MVSLLHIDTAVCGTGIVARDLAPDNPVAAEVARVVCDYDLWKHADPRSAVLGQVLQRKANREHVRDCLVRGIFSDEQIAQEYASIKAEMEAMMLRSLKHATFTGTKYRVVFAPALRVPERDRPFHPRPEEDRD